MTETFTSDIRSLFGGGSHPASDVAMNYYQLSLQRTTIGNYMGEGDQAVHEQLEAEKSSKTPQKKIGWKMGVLTRDLCSIFGVVLMLRLPYVVGNLGAIQATMVILASVTVTLTTTLSLSAISTNGRVGSGGVYYMLSRALGPLWGGAVGIMFFIANATSVALYIIGFCESLLELMDSSITGSLINDTRIVGIVVLLLLLGSCMFGVGWIMKMDLTLLIVLCSALLSIFIGTPRFGMSTDMLMESMHPMEGSESFFTVLAVFFPAATGIMAGANISGSLQNPSKDIPKGTLTAIGISTSVYVALAWMIAAAVPQDSSSNLELFIMGALSVWQPLVYAGVFAATISSALGSLVGAPQVLQSLCQDGIIPVLSPLGKGREKDGEPIRAYFVTAGIAAAAILVGSLNAIAPLISNFFLLSYGLVNYAVLVAANAKGPGWRPSWRYWSRGTAFLGGALCVAMMVLLSPVTAIISFLILSALYLYMQRTIYAPATNDQQAQQVIEAAQGNPGPGTYGDMTLARRVTDAAEALQRLEPLRLRPHVKTYRPHMLCLCGKPQFRPYLPAFARQLVGAADGLLVLGDVIPGDWSPDNLKAFRKEATMNGAYTAAAPLLKQSCHYEAVPAPSLREGARSLLALGGLGPLQPNVLMLGWLARWRQGQGVEDWVGVLRDAAFLEIGLVVPRNLDAGGLFSTSPLSDPAFITLGHSDGPERPKGGCCEGTVHDPEPEKVEMVTPYTGDIPGGLEAIREEGEHEADEEEALIPGFTDPDAFTHRQELAERLSMSSSPTRFHCPTSSSPVKGRVDVAWLVDDGGLGLLLPWMLQTSSAWRSRLRVLITSHPRRLRENTQRTHDLLQGFRIDAEVDSIEHERLVDPGEIMSRLRGRQHAPSTSTLLTTAATVDDGAFTLLPDSQVVPEAAPRSIGDIFGTPTLRRTRTIPTTQQEIDAEAAQAIVAQWVAGSRDMPAIWTANDATVAEATRLRTGVSVPPALRRQLCRYARLNALLRKKCHDASALFVTMPIPRPIWPCETYMGLLDLLSDVPGVPVILVRGSGANVLTFDA